jgi:glycerol-3-phosphate acyltransferase PlsY
MDHWFVLLCLSAIVGYVFGSIPFGLILTKLAGLGDVREIGSGNIGATNVLRTGKKPLAALTLLADILKGLIPTLLVTTYFELIPYGLIAGFMALIGHMFPVWLKFKGGKGVATYIGVAFGFFWPSGLCFILSWLVVAFLFRYSSLSALVACLVTPFVTFFLTEEIIATTLFVMSILVLIRHRSNIERLIAGEEDKIGQKQTS